MQSYRPIHTSRSEFVEIRGVKYHLRRWGNPDAPLLFMLHGWLDLSATYQFVVDAFTQEWNIIAPDWSGYGLSDARQGATQLYETVADLAVLADIFSPKQPVKIVAHSMGANIAGLYIGALPDRVSHWVNLEGLAPVPGFKYNSVRGLTEWLDANLHGRSARIYPSTDDFCQRLLKANRLLTLDKALFLANEFCYQLDDGRVRLRADPLSEVPSPFFPHRDQLVETWRMITAKTLFIIGGESLIMRQFDVDPEEVGRRINAVAGSRQHLIPGVGHNLHHDQPDTVARLIEEHFRT